MALLRFVLKRLALLTLVFFLFVTFLVLFVNLLPSNNPYNPATRTMMDDVAWMQSFREAEWSCRLDEACNDLPWWDRQSEISQRRATILAELMAEPIPSRILRQVWEYATIDWGTAMNLQSRTGSLLIVDIIVDRLPFTLGLFATGTILGAFVGIRMGLRMASRPMGKGDRGLTFLSLTTTSVPPWLWGLLFIILFAYALHWFPAYGYVSVPPPQDPWAYFADFLWHLALPLATLTFASFGAWAYVTRNLVLPTEGEDYVTAARARGVPERTVMRRHVLRVSYPPIITTLVIALLATLNGIILVEAIFGWPGMGWLYWEALSFGNVERYGPVDIPVLIVLPIAYAMMFLVVIFVLDFTYGFFDPRIRGVHKR